MWGISSLWSALIFNRPAREIPGSTSKLKSIDGKSYNFAAYGTPATLASRELNDRPERLFIGTCFSTSVGVAGKIAGNARNKPPITGPYDFAIIPVATVAKPPNRKRKTISYHLVRRRADNLNLITIYLSTRSQIPKLVRSQATIREVEISRAGGLYLNMTHKTTEA